MNIIFRHIVKIGLEIAARENIKKSDGIVIPDSATQQIACFAHDTITRKIMLYGVFEKHELMAVKKLLIDQRITCDTCLDIGANIGNHTLFFADFFTKVISFEPNERPFKLLKFNSSLTDNIQPFNIGLSTNTMELPAKLKPLNSGSARICDNDESDTFFSVVSLDDFLVDNKHSNISFMKIDVEGHELMVLQGAKSTIIQHKPMIALEMHFKKDIKNNVEILDLLEELGYQQTYILRYRFFGALNYFFKNMSISEFRNLPIRNYRMVLFEASK